MAKDKKVVTKPVDFETFQIPCPKCKELNSIVVCFKGGFKDRISFDCPHCGTDVLVLIDR